jgi:serine/threonine protein kinase
MRQLSSEDYAHRFRREGTFMLEFVHPCLVRCIDAGEDADAGSYLVCEFVPGLDLGKFVREKGPQHPKWTINLIVQLPAALHFLHTRPGIIVHRGVKPDNILLRRPDDQGGAAPQAKLAGLVISRALEGPGSTRLTMPGAVPGTIAYLAPEIFSGISYGPQAGVYSAGVTALCSHRKAHV